MEGPVENPTLKVQCTCGQTLVDGAGGSPLKGRVLPDVLLDEVLEEIDRIVEGTGTADRDRSSACMEIRTLLLGACKQVWQCPACGSLFIDNSPTESLQFRPLGSEAVRLVLDAAGAISARAKGPPPST